LVVSDPDRLAAALWPPIGYETWPWESAASVPASRAARCRHRGPYQSAVVSEIARRAVPLPPEITALIDDAAAEVARFDAELGREMAPFAAVLLRSESAASSKIENLTASARAIAEAELHPYAGRNASLIVANEQAMSAAIALAERIDGDAILAMHAALLDRTNPDIAGRWRHEQVWIGGSDLGPHGALFVPPHHSRLLAAIVDLVAFIEREDVPVLAHAAVAHAQFETIHPFPDGNGRTGRALVHAHLRQKGLTRNVTMPISAGLLTETDAYFAALTRYREGDPVPIVDQFARAAFAAIGNGRLLVDELHAIRNGWDERVRVRRGATAWRIADYRSLQPHVEAGVLIEFTDKKRNQLWRAPEVLDALDRFAARAGRRSRAAR